MEATKLDLIIKNLEILNRNQIILFKELLEVEDRLYKSEGKEFTRNYLADLASMATGELGFIDLINYLKK